MDYKACEYRNEAVNGHKLNLFLVDDDKLEQVCSMVATIIPSHYTSESRIAHLLEKLGKQKAAAYLRDKLPETPKIRSGDLGEILATHFVDECTEYKAPIKRLRWKDHREMAMRGDDIIGIALNDGNQQVKFLKGEAKSRKSLSTNVVQEARSALNACDGMPTPHSLAFISERLFDMGKVELADLISQAQLTDGISEQQVSHLLFIFCGNEPYRYLKKDLDDYTGPFPQSAVGLIAGKHQDFIFKVYSQVGQG